MDSNKTNTPKNNDEYDVVKCKGGVRLTKYRGKAEEVTIPKTYKGQPVVELGNTFSCNEYVKTVYVAPTVRKIAAEAFYEPYDAHETSHHFFSPDDVYIPSSVKKIVFRGFYGTVHCAENSAAHRAAASEMFVKFEIDPSMDIEETIEGTDGDYSFDIPDFEYTLDENGGIILTAYIGKSKKVVIPKSYNGRPIVGLQRLFLGKEITSVTIPDSVKNIGKDAFMYCRSLKSIKLSDGLTELSPMAFYNCSSLISVELPDGLRAIRKDAFGDCEKLVSVTIPDGVSIIENDAFRGCDELTVRCHKGSFAWAYCEENGIALSELKKGYKRDGFFSRKK